MPPFTLCVGRGITRKLCYRKEYRVMRLIYITRKSQSNLRRATSPPRTQPIPLVAMESPKLSPSQNCSFSLDDYHQNLTRQYQDPTPTTIPNGIRSTQPFCHSITSTSTQPSIKLLIDNHATPQTHSKTAPSHSTITTKI